MRPKEHSRILDACVGDGAIATFYRAHEEYGVITNDLDNGRKADYHYDASNPLLYDKARCEWWITNPPFNQIDDILRAALEYCTNVITLARLSILEPTAARREIYKYYQPDMLIVLPRYSFRLNDEGKRQTDSVTCCWLGFGPDVPRITTVWTKESNDDE